MLCLAWVDWRTGTEFNPSLVYPSILLIGWWINRSRWLWLLASLGIALTFLVSLVEDFDQRAYVHRLLAGITVIAVAGIMHALLRTRARLETQNLQLQEAIDRLAARELDIERQNQELSAHKVRLEALLTENERRRKQAEEASERKTRFLSIVSHDIRTPANAISLLAELIKRTAARPDLVADIPQMAKELYSSASSLVNLVTDTLDLTRMDAGRVTLNETEFDLPNFLRDQCRHLQPLATQKGLGFHLTAVPGPMKVRTDRVKLGRVLDNIVGNAIKFTERGEVSVSATLSDAGALSLQILDTGPGIPLQHQLDIFDEFFQLRQRDSSLPGSGLGLSICKRIVDAMGGELTVQSTGGQGSTFTIHLPGVKVGDGV